MRSKSWGGIAISVDSRFPEGTVEAGRKGWWLGLAVVLLATLVFVAAVLAGVFAPPRETPEAVFLIAYPDGGAELLTAWWAGRAAWPAAWLYSDTLRDGAFLGRLRAAGFDPASVSGISPAPPDAPPGSVAAAAFAAEYRNATGTAPALFDANAYDALFLLALAFQKSQTLDTNATAFKEALRSVANPPGVPIRPGMWAEARENLTRGAEIDYQGASGAVDFDASGEVSSDFEAWRVDAAGNASRWSFIPDGSWTRGTPAREAGTGGPGPSPRQADVKIGTLFDLSGPLRDFGRHMENATELAAGDVAAGGGITIGGVPARIVLVHRDEGPTPATAAAAAGGLATVDRVNAVVGGASSPASAAAFPVLSRAGILEVSPSASAPALTAADTTDQFWRTLPSASVEGSAAALHAYAGRGWRTVSILYVDDAYGSGLASSFRADFDARGGRVLRAVPFPSDPAGIDAQAVLSLLFSPSVPSPPYRPAVADRRTEP